MLMLVKIMPVISQAPEQQPTARGYPYSHQPEGSAHIDDADTVDDDAGPQVRPRRGRATAHSTLVAQPADGARQL